jgi:hypothetical protein
MALSDHLRSLMGSAAAVDVHVSAVEPATAEPGKDDPAPDTSTDDTGKDGDKEKAAVQPAATAPQPEAPKVADPAEVAEFCAANGCPALAGPLIREKATMDQVKARVGAADAIRAMVKDARVIAPAITATAADEYIAAGLSVEDVRAKLWDRVVKAQSPEIRGSIAADTGADTAKAGWDKAVAKVNARIEGNTQPKEG